MAPEIVNVDTVDWKIIRRIISNLMSNKIVCVCVCIYTCLYIPENMINGIMCFQGVFPWSSVDTVVCLFVCFLSNVVTMIKQISLKTAK